MNATKLSLFLALLSLAPAGFAADAPRKIATVEGITEYQLDNGLRFLLFPDPAQARVTVNMTALVGSRQEGYGETGMAHLLEHMLFKGTPHHPDIPKALRDHGASFNGSTSTDRVNYYETMAASDENLEFGIDLESDRLVNSFIAKKDLDSEMTVVRSEFERGENSPQGVLMERIEEVAYDWHNYGKPTIGNRSDIERVPIQNLQAFYRKYYQPDNIVLIIAGKFDEAKALALVQKYFGPIPRPARKLDNTWTEEPPQDGERQVTLRRVGDLGIVGVAYHVPSAAHEDSAALQILANILSAQPSGRLYKALVETKKAASASAGVRAEHDPGLMTMTAQLAADSSIEEVRDILLNTVEQIGVQGVTPEEVSRAKQQISRARERTSADTAALGVSFSTWVSQGDWRLYFLQRDRLEKVTPADVQAVAAHYLQRNNRTLGMFIPTEKAERIVVPASPDLNALVANYTGRAAADQGEAFDTSPANVEAHVQRLDLPEGIKASILTKKSRAQEVHLTLTLRYGNEQNLKDLETAGGFLPELMMRGTKKLSQQQMRDELERLDATLGTGAGGGGRGGGGRGGRGGGGGGGAAGAVSFSIQAKRDNLPAVLEILRQVLHEPLLPADQFELLKKSRLAGLEGSRSEPATLAARSLQRQLNPYTPDNIRYVPTVDEAIDRLRKASYEQVVQIYHDYLGSQNGELTVVGDFDADKCMPIIKGMLAGWKAAQPYARIAAGAPAAVPGSQQAINTPDKANANYLAGEEIAVRDDDPDYAALLMGNYILGHDTLSARLGTRIRQKDGLSYGVTSSFAASSQDPRATLTITAICNPTNITHLSMDVQEEIDRLLRDGVTKQELEDARKGWLESQKVARSSDAALAGALANARHLGRTMNYEDDLRKHVESLTPEQVQAALRKYIDPKKLVIVTAGDFEVKPTKPIQ